MAVQHLRVMSQQSLGKTDVGNILQHKDLVGNFNCVSEYDGDEIDGEEVEPQQARKEKCPYIIFQILKKQNYSF